MKLPAETGLRPFRFTSFYLVEIICAPSDYSRIQSIVRARYWKRNCIYSARIHVSLSLSLSRLRMLFKITLSFIGLPSRPMKRVCLRQNKTIVRSTVPRQSSADRCRSLDDSSLGPATVQRYAVLYVGQSA